jgi:hypothetical protein
MAWDNGVSKGPDPAKPSFKLTGSVAATQEKAGEIP